MRRSLSRAAVLVAMILPVTLLPLGGATAGGMTAAPSSAQVSRPEDVEVTSGDRVALSVNLAAGGPAVDVGWQYSVDSGRTWRTLDGASGTDDTISAVTARDGWKVRAKLWNDAGVAYSHSAWIRVHSRPSDPFPTSASAAAPRLSGWDWSSTSTSFTGLRARGTATWTKRDASALVSDVHVAYRDASGTSYPVTVSKTSVSGAAVRVALGASLPAAAARSTSGDTWKVRDTVTDESEYFAVRSDVAASTAWKSVGPARFASPVGPLAAQVIPMSSIWPRSGQQATFHVATRRLTGATVTWDYNLEGGLGAWLPLTGRTGSSLTLTATSARSLWLVRARASTAGGSSTTSAWFNVGSTLSDPYATGYRGHGLYERVGTWDVGTTTTRRTSRAVTLDINLIRSYRNESPRTVVVWFRDGGGTWTRASVATTVWPDQAGNYTLHATATPAAAAIRASAGDVWRITDTSYVESQYFVAG